jgi:hypothetical protein
MSIAILHLAQTSFEPSIPDKSINDVCNCFSRLFKSEYDPINVEFQGDNELFMYIKDKNINDESANFSVLKLAIKQNKSSYTFSINNDSGIKYEIKQIFDLDKNIDPSFKDMSNIYNKHKFILSTVQRNTFIRIYSNKPNPADKPLAKYTKDTNFTLEISHDETFDPSNTH